MKIMYDVINTLSSPANTSFPDLDVLLSLLHLNNESFVNGCVFLFICATLEPLHVLGYY